MGLVTYRPQPVRVPSTGALHGEERVDRNLRLNYMSRKSFEGLDMRAETTKVIAEIEQVLSLLRRHL
jgi:hypothetical protein